MVPGESWRARRGWRGRVYYDYTYTYHRLSPLVFVFIQLSILSIYMEARRYSAFFAMDSGSLKSASGAFVLFCPQPRPLKWNGYNLESTYHRILLSSSHRIFPSLQPKKTWVWPWQGTAASCLTAIAFIGVFLLFLYAYRPAGLSSGQEYPKAVVGCCLPTEGGTDGGFTWRQGVINMGQAIEP